MEIFCGLVGLAFILVVIAVVGHVLWLAGAAVFGASEVTPSIGRCPACAAKLIPGQIRCFKCGFEIRTARQGTLDEELAATRRQLQRLRKANKISDATWETVVEALRDDARERELGFPLLKDEADAVEVIEAADIVEEPVAAMADRLPSSAPVIEPADVAVFEPSAWTPVALETSREESQSPRAVAGLLQAFMEEKNIRWGELISGLLIVGSSVGLVISLWATLKEAIPYFPVAVFLTATAAMHGAGLYTLNRWRLKSTSRGLLLVSTLLIPLNVLAAMVLNEKKPTYETIDYAAFAIGLSVLSAIAFSAARVLNRRNPWPMVIAVVGTAIGMSTIGRLARPGGEMVRTLGLFALPFFSFLIGSIAHLVSLSLGRRLSVRRVAQSFRFFGIAAFGLVLAGGLLAAKCGDVRETLSLLSPMLAVVAATLAGAGLIVHQRLTDPEQAGFRLAGTSIALGGGLLAMAALALAWPRPDLLVAVGLLDAIAFTALAWFAAFPELHVVATGSFALAFLVGVNWATGEITVVGATSELLISLLLTARSALILALLSLAADGVGYAISRFKSTQHAVAYFGSAMLQEAVGVAIAGWVVWKDRPDQDLATIVFAIVALRWLVATWWIRRSYAGWIAACLLLATVGHGLAMNDYLSQMLAAHGMHPADPWEMSLLVHATICLGCAPLARRLEGDGPDASEPRDQGIVWPFAAAAIATSALAVPMLLDLRTAHFLTHGVYAFWASGIWFALALLGGSASLAVASQILATVGVILGVTGLCSRQLWWTGQFGDPLFLNWQFGALAVWSGLWIAGRRLGQRAPAVACVLNCEPTSVDRVVLACVTLGLAATSLIATWPGVIAELTLIAGQTIGRPYVTAVLIPFGVGALLAAAHAISGEKWQKTPALVMGTCLIGAIALTAPLYALGWSWPVLPTPYGQGWGAGVWPALAIALLAMLAAHWERPNRATLVGIALLLSAIPYLVACRWDAEHGTATALRWGAATGGLIVAALWALYRTLTPMPVATMDEDESPPNQFRLLRDVLIAATTLPVLILTAQTLIDFVTGRIIPISGGPENYFIPYLSETVPLGILAAAFVTYAIADRRALWGLAASFLLELAWGIAAGLSLVATNHSQTMAEAARFLQCMGLLAVFAAAAWCAIEMFVQWRTSRSEEKLAAIRLPIQTQLGFVGVIVALLTVGATIGLWIQPQPLFDSVRQCGQPLAWAFLISATVVWMWFLRGSWRLSAIKIGLLLFSAAAVFGAASLDYWNTADNWLSFHAAMIGWCAVLALSAGASVLTRTEDRWNEALAIANRALLLVPVIILFALKAEVFDPLRPWWAAGAVIWLSLCLMAVSVGARSQVLSYVSFLFAILASACIGARPWLDAVHANGWQRHVDFVHIVVIGMGLHGILSLAIELARKRNSEFAHETLLTAPPVHHSACGIGTVVLVFTTIAVLARQPFFPDLSCATPLALGALGAMVVLAAGSLWEERAEHSFPLLYALGLVAVATFLDWRQLDPRDLIFAAAASAAGYVVLSGVLWTIGEPLKKVGLRLRLSPFSIDGQRVAPWLGPVSSAIGALVIAVEFWVVMTFAETSLRIGGALATLAVGGGLAMLSTSRAKEILQTAALAVGAMAAVQFGWSLMPPIDLAAHEELLRAIRMMAMLGATTFVYGLPLVRLTPVGSSWFFAVRRTAIGVAATTIATLALVLVFEITRFDPTNGAPESVGDCVLVASTLVLLAAGLISLALLPGRDPFFRFERQRFLYVYAAEAVCGLLCAHLYLTNPHFFQYTLRPYWPLVVMAIAYAGIGLSEAFRRFRITVLAEPLEYSAAFLPVLPVIGFWFLAPDPDLHYSTVLVVIGLLYLFLSLRRGSVVYPAAAALVGNATLCSLLYDNGITLLLHPQMFVIPPCLTVLAAAQINRDRLDPRTLASLRYFAMTAIYVSSTGEMFQHGIGTTLWLPMVLAGLSVFGVLGGIVLRVRAFLYLGTSFLLLSIVSMVWHAARSIGHVWPWWVFLFALGVGLLTLFGVFEKKRPEVLALVGSLRHWER